MMAYEYAVPKICMRVHVYVCMCMSMYIPCSQKFCWEKISSNFRLLLLFANFSSRELFFCVNDCIKSLTIILVKISNISIMPWA